MKHCGQRGEFVLQLEGMEEWTVKQWLGRYLDLLQLLHNNPKQIPQMANLFLLTKRLPPLSGKSPL